jgi:hypothetical protein
MAPPSRPLRPLSCPPRPHASPALSGPSLLILIAPSLNTLVAAAFLHAALFSSTLYPTRCLILRCHTPLHPLAYSLPASLSLSRSLARSLARSLSFSLARSSSLSNRGARAGPTSCWGTHTAATRSRAAPRTRHTSYTPHTRHTSYTPHTRYTSYTPHTRHTSYTPHTRHTSYTPHTRHTSYTPHTRYTHRRITHTAIGSRTLPPHVPAATCACRATCIVQPRAQHGHCSVRPRADAPAHHRPLLSNHSMSAAESTCYGLMYAMA